MEVLVAEVDEDGRIVCVHRLLTFSYKRESTKPKFLSFFLRESVLRASNDNGKILKKGLCYLVSGVKYTEEIR
jgi:hypothetical protein